MSGHRTARTAVLGVAGAAALIAAVTALSRVVGFGRWLVFAEAFDGASCLGTAYATANMVPNLVFEVVAGGALAGAVVPLVTGPLARADRETVRATVSALLTWVLLVLGPLSMLGIALSGPLMRALIGDPRGCSGPQVAAVAASMFVVFAPQILLYGVAVVCGGVLNAHRRFLAAAVAPLASSLVVVTTYAWFAVGYRGSRDDVAELPAAWAALLAWGTTGGVLALALVVGLPVARLRLGLRPTLRFPPGVAARARALALSGLVALLAQQLTVLVAILLTNRVGGAVTVYNYAWAVYVLPWAVLAVPIATSAFTVLAEQAGRGDRAGYAATAAATTRAALLASCLGAGVLAGTAGPVAATFLRPAEDPAALHVALLAFAPGLVGYGLVAQLGRALHARGAGRSAGTAIATGWVLAAAGAVVAAGLAPDRWVVAAVGAGNSLGMLVAGALLLRATAAVGGRAALAGVARAGGAGLAGALAAAAAAAALAAALPSGGKLLAGLVAATAAAAGLLVFAAIVLALDGEDLRAVLRRRVTRG